MDIKVKASSMGYFEGEIKDIDAVFYIRSKEQFSKKWMIDVDGVLAEKKEEAPSKPAKKASESASKNLI